MGWGNQLLALLSGAKIVQQGRLKVLGGDIADKHHRIPCLPIYCLYAAGFRKNLYKTLSVEENLQFVARYLGMMPSSDANGLMN
jgi:ribosome-dependent ATPase